MKYNFFTGDNAKKVKVKGYKYLGKGSIGKIETIKIDGKTFYYLVDFGIGMKQGPYTEYKKKFIKVEVEDLQYNKKKISEIKKKYEAGELAIWFKKMEELKERLSPESVSKDYLKYFGRFAL